MYLTPGLTYNDYISITKQVCRTVLRHFPTCCEADQEGRAPQHTADGRCTPAPTRTQTLQTTTNCAHRGVPAAAAGAAGSAWWLWFQRKCL